MGRLVKNEVVEMVSSHSDSNSDLSLSVHYHTKVDGKKLSEKRKPQNVNFNDF